MAVLKVGVSKINTAKYISVKKNDQEDKLVTFVLFAYNQELVIREAVEAAFAQSYRPLQIILSDDCSTDLTYILMREMVSSYTGPHNILVRQSHTNRGLVAHINEVSSLFKGEIVVFAAGDDISHPDRCKTVARAFLEYPCAMAVVSGFESISEIDAPPISSLQWMKNNLGLEAEELELIDIVNAAGGIGAGAAYAYQRKCFKWPGPLPEEILSEDRILPLRAALLGSVYRINDVLVKYRVSTTSLSAQFARCKLNSYQRPDHWRAIRLTLYRALQNSKLSFQSFCLLRFSARVSQTLFKSRALTQSLLRTWIVRALSMLLRIVRYIQTRHCKKH